MITGQFNQAGALAPTTGPDGLAFERAVPALMVPETVYPYRHAYGGWVGAVLITGVQDSALVGGAGYDGVMPASAQPTIDRPEPWDV